jgi:hypothetical protein
MSITKPARNEETYRIYLHHTRIRGVGLYLNALYCINRMRFESERKFKVRTNLVSRLEVLAGSLGESVVDRVIPDILFIANCSCSQANIGSLRNIFLCMS